MDKKVSFFPFDAMHKIINNKAVAYLFGRTASGEQICVTDRHFQPYFYIIPKKGMDIEERIKKIIIKHDEGASQVTKVVHVKKHFLGKEVDALQVFVPLPRDVVVLREAVKDWEGIESCNEYDLPFKKRFLIDKQIIPLALVSAEGDFVNETSRVPVFEAKSIIKEKDEFLEEPKVLAFDIETYSSDGGPIDMAKNPILMAAFYGKHFKKVICSKHFKTDLPYVEFVSSEEDLIKRWKEVVEIQKPDILCGYNSDGFDLPYLKARAEKYRIKLDIGLDYSEVSIERRKDTNADIVGIAHVDVYRFVRRTLGPTLDSSGLTLKAVSAQLLGETKTDAKVDELSGVWDNHPEKLGPFIEYNLQDAYLVFALMEKLLPNMLEMNKIVGLPLPDLARMGYSQLVESFILREAFRQNELAPELPHHGELRKRMARTYIGGFVYEPEPGMYDNIVVFDFRSLYPSIISSHNIDPGTLNCACCEGKEEVPLGGKSKLWFCRNRKGFLPTLVGDIISRRMRVQEMLKHHKSPILEARSYSLKILANSFYGYLGFAMARWYCFECAQSTSAFGRHYIGTVISKAREEGFKVIYSDTDSVFITLGGRAKADAERFREKINDSLTGLMELEYEGFYPSGIFVSAKVGRFGAKKKYALLSEKGNLKIRGFETVRRNWSRIAKTTQEKVLQIILKEKDTKKALKLVKDTVQQLRKHEVPLSEVVIATQLTKEIRAYENVGPHVAIAELMKKQGKAVAPGTIIKYIVTQGEAKIRDRAKVPEEVSQKEYDAEYYINNQVVPAVEKIFEVLGFTVEELAAQKSQQNLGKFIS
ncbi:ribonuclease H-like domain-containing protein [Candidatus Woesearchaeota archaeon]|nr:ribonuclease H-like domain-containing protein [Candidatus Woesearchaeota archaeon]